MCCSRVLVCVCASVCACVYCVHETMAHAYDWYVAIIRPVAKALPLSEYVLKIVYMQQMSLLPL